MTLENFTKACCEAMEFTDFQTGDECHGARIANETYDRLKADCASFWFRTNCYFEPAGRTAEQAGHDFWLTRNGHGAGFWDGDWPKPYDELLTNIAKGYGEFELYVGDDGSVYA